MSTLSRMMSAKGTRIDFDSDEDEELAIECNTCGALIEGPFKVDSTCPNCYTQFDCTTPCYGCGVPFRVESSNFCPECAACPSCGAISENSGGLCTTCEAEIGDIPPTPNSVISLNNEKQADLVVIDLTAEDAEPEVIDLTEENSADSVATEVIDLTAEPISGRKTPSRGECTQWRFQAPKAKRVKYTSDTEEAVFDSDESEEEWDSDEDWDTEDEE